MRPLQQVYREQHGASLVYLADEWYLLAGEDVPNAETYDGFPQIENGIGLVRQFLDDSLEFSPPDLVLGIRHCTLACGTLIAPVMRRAAGRMASASGVRIDVAPIANRLFGETVTVSGLLAGRDVIAALKGTDLGEFVFLPRVMFADYPGREAAACTLDGLTLQDVASRLGRPVALAGRMSEVGQALAEEQAHD
jgi:NifB/MoaA-like Fe-S oxidoreductase